MDRLRSLAFALFFYGLSVPVVLCVPIAGLFGARALRRYANGWAGLMRWSACWILGIDARIEGESAAPPPAKRTRSAEPPAKPSAAKKQEELF